MSQINYLPKPNIFDSKLNVSNVSLVAFYGNKPAPLANLIEQLQTYLANHQLVAGKFIPYQLKQVHGTIMGGEGLKTESGVINKWFYQRRRETKYIDLSGLINYLQHQVNLPLTIRFGGYDPNVDYNFFSRQQHLYFRSCQLQPMMEQTVPVLIGWSWHNSQVSFAINDIRCQLQQFNLLHKYHSTPKAIDNDFYLRLGTINTKLSSEVLQKIVAELRELLATQAALYIPLKLENLAFAQYQDLSLTPETTKVIPANKITATQLNKLYDASN